MRLSLALAFVIATVPAFAQTPLTGATGEPTTNTPPLAGTAIAPGPAAGPAAGAQTPARGKAGHGHHPRRPFAARFSEADTDHDGSLTLAEARAGKMGEVVRDFGLIDKDKKGTVTVDQIRDFRRARRAARAADEAR